MAGKALIRMRTGSALRDVGADCALQVIEPSRGTLGIDFREIWRYRELLYFLIWRDVKIRYKQTALGTSWAVLQPFLTMLVFAVFFGNLAGLGDKTGHIPYPIFAFAGLLPWTFFANAINNTSNSLVGNANLITKVYFPRLIIPLAAVLAQVVDLLVSFVVLAALMLYYHIPLTRQLALVPVFMIGTILAATGTGALLSALTVTYRDFRHVVPFMVQLWMFLTPVIYPSFIVPGRWRWLLALNPMTGLINGFRGAFLGIPLNWSHVGVSLVMAVIMFAYGAVYFRRVERQFADVI